MTPRHIRATAVDPGTLTIDDCTCIKHCSSTADACHLSGRSHTHPRDERGDLGPCPVHRDVPSGP